MNLKNRPDNPGGLDGCLFTFRKNGGVKSDQFSCGNTNYNLSAYSESWMIFHRDEDHNRGVNFI
jgi:hypothetical protein